MARALSRRARVVACASTGSAATSLAGAAASVGLPCLIFVPEFAPEPKLAQLLIFGTRVLRVQGGYDATWELCHRACERHGWYNRNAAVNPSLVEGKKTAGLEIAEQCRADLPGWVAVSVGDGCTIAGIWKGEEPPHFEFVTWHSATLLKDCLAAVCCELYQVVEAGDHYIVIGQAIDVHIGDEPVDPLMFHAGKYRELETG